MLEIEKKEGALSKALPSSGSEQAKEPIVNWSVYSLVFEVGYTIAIPLVLCAVGGRYLDKMLNTSPWLLLFGIIISIFISSFLVYRKVSKILY